MTEQRETPDAQPARASEDHAPAASSPEPATSWLPADAAAQSTDATAAQYPERPELAVGAAFAGGFLLALILRRLAR